MATVQLCRRRSEGVAVRHDVESAPVVALVVVAVRQVAASVVPLPVLVRLGEGRLACTSFCAGFRGVEPRAKALPGLLVQRSLTPSGAIPSLEATLLRLHPRHFFG